MSVWKSHVMLLKIFLSGHWQCPVLECELTKLFFSYSDGKSILIASTLIEVWWAAWTLVNWPFTVWTDIWWYQSILKVRMASHEGSVCLKGVQKCKKLCKCLFGYICKAFRLLIQMDLVQASTDFISLRKNYRISFKNKLHVFFRALFI